MRSHPKSPTQSDEPIPAEQLPPLTYVAITVTTGATGSIVLGPANQQFIAGYDPNEPAPR